MPGRPVRRRGRLDLPSMRHLLLYRFVPTTSLHELPPASPAHRNIRPARRFGTEDGGSGDSPVGYRSTYGSDSGVSMTALLALDAGGEGDRLGRVQRRRGDRKRGHRTFGPPQGGTRSPRRSTNRVTNELASQWWPQAVALCQPSDINWPVLALDLLVSSLTRWSSGRGLP